MKTDPRPTPRAFRDLARMRDNELFAELAEGLANLHEHVLKLEADILDAGNAKLARLVRVGTALLREEAAKYLILLDAARCPRSGLGHHLAKASSHVARAIYADVCEWHVVNFGELRRHIESELREFYLDGPNDVDWIFTNSLNAEREQALYVDYCRTDDGGHYWHTPLHLDETICGWASVPTVAKLVKAIHAAGVGSAEALAHVAALWRGVAVHDEMHHAELEDLNRQTLVTLDEKRVLIACPDETYREILDRWPFPLHSMKLALLDTDLRELREERASRSPGWEYYE